MLATVRHPIRTVRTAWICLEETEEG